MADVETQYSGMDFERIQMAQHFILGFDCNNTYVAFWRSLSIQSEFIESSEEAAKYVEELSQYEPFEIITSEIPNMSHFQRHNANRIIFSGHGLAGA